MNFTLDPRLENDSVLICDWNLSQVRLHRNAAFPWIMLIPRRADIVEIIDLSETDQEELLREIRFASWVMKKLHAPHKINVANLGNVVAQLHVHVVARYSDDKAWPGPIWGTGVTAAYEAHDLEQRIAELQRELGAFV